MTGQGSAQPQRALSRGQVGSSGVPVCLLPPFLASFFIYCLEATLRDISESKQACNFKTFQYLKKINILLNTFHQFFCPIKKYRKSSRKITILIGHQTSNAFLVQVLRSINKIWYVIHKTYSTKRFESIFCFLNIKVFHENLLNRDKLQ